MNNFPVKVDGKEYWISRSVAGVLYVLKKVDNDLLWLIEKRGKGAADNKGKYCTICGYCDYDEKIDVPYNGKESTIAREAREETGFILRNPYDVELICVNSDPSEQFQNISLSYVYWAESDEDFDLKKAKGGEKDEVEEVKWFKLGTFINDELQINGYDIIAEDWAFGHEKRIVNYLSEKFNISLNKNGKEKEQKHPG